MARHVWRWASARASCSGPVIAPVAASPAVAAGVAQPSEDEASAAVRRHRLFTGTSLANATLKLGDCSPGGVGPDLTCMTQIVLDSTKPNAAPQNRPIGFARVDGQWEVAVWWRRHAIAYGASGVGSGQAAIQRATAASCK
ncbi:hypothetical protein [Neorhizobium sp. DT-125]|uniref:hypothetical protein n=1 Tax=Neorhizobium sp. DT-125 TaxID=3396163 RepID=UPI003F1A26B3